MSRRENCWYNILYISLSDSLQQQTTSWIQGVNWKHIRYSEDIKDLQGFLNISHQYFQFFNSPIILRSQSTHQADDNVSWYFFSKLIPLKIYGFPQIKKKLLCKVWKCPETTQRISKNQYPGALLLWRPYKIPHGTVRVGDP